MSTPSPTVIVHGELRARPGSRQPLLQASLDHVQRSRTEDGCLQHEVAIDPGDADRLLFVERWSSLQALQAHLANDGSRSFARAIAAHAAVAPVLRIFTAQPVPLDRAGPG